MLSFTAVNSKNEHLFVKRKHLVHKQTFLQSLTVEQDKLERSFLSSFFSD
jgi:hypothetical protein